METKVLLKYHRDCDAWLCPECDTENPISVTNCDVCNCKRSSSFIILKQFTKETEPPITPVNKTKTPDTSVTLFNAIDDDYIQEEKNPMKIVWGIFIVFLIIILIVAASNANACSPYSGITNDLILNLQQFYYQSQ